VSESDVVAMANDLGKEWMWVGRLLGLEDTALDDIKESHDKLYECSYKMLLCCCHGPRRIQPRQSITGLHRHYSIEQ